MSRTVTVCTDANVLLVFFNDEPDKVESCTAFFQLLFTRRIKSVVAIIALLELAAILTAALSRYPSLKIARMHTCREKQPSKQYFDKSKIELYICQHVSPPSSFRFLEGL